jgi:hypothetical protein
MGSTSGLEGCRAFVAKSKLLSTIATSLTFGTLPLWRVVTLTVFSGLVRESSNLFLFSDLDETLTLHSDLEEARTHAALFKVANIWLN